MRKFPGKTELVKVGKTRKYVLTDEQEEWLRTWYPTTENSRLAKMMGIGLSRLHDFARENGLSKSESGLKDIKRRQTKAMAKTNHKHGCYDRKRGKPVSSATMEGSQRRWAEEHAGLRENAILRMKREEPDRYKAIQEKRSQNRREMIRKEKRRIIYGLERKTNIKVIVMKPFTRSQIARRHSALKRGYLLDEDCSEGQPGRYVIYYDDETRRCEKFEENCINDGFTFKFND